MTNYEKSYDDIINLPPPISEKHPKMPIPDRAAQFAPFSAVVGHDAAVREVARITEKRAELDEDEIRLLDQKLHALTAVLVTRPRATVTYYQNDARKSGGHYLTADGEFEGLDDTGAYVFAGGIKIPIETIVDIDSPVFYIEEEQTELSD